MAPYEDGGVVHYEDGVFIMAKKKLVWLFMKMMCLFMKMMCLFMNMVLLIIKMVLLIM